MKTIIIGAGPAGIMAAISAANNGDDVVLLEKNEKIGKKLFITGKGRCNVTNACTRDEFFENVVSNPKFLYSAFSQFNNEDLMRLIEDNGTPLKTERGNRVFPVSDHSSDIIKALNNAIKQAHVDLRLNTSVKSILFEADNKLMVGNNPECSDKSVTGIRTDNGEIIKGDKTTMWHLRYLMKFMRSTSGTGSSEAPKFCPNCGAPLEIASSGKCEYCGSTITSTSFDWLLSDFTTVRNDTKDDGIRV